jgi:hypothetical protein
VLLDRIQRCYEYEGKLIFDTESEVTPDHVWRAKKYYGNTTEISWVKA